MADDKKPDAQQGAPAPAQQTIVTESQEQRASRAIAQAATDAAERKADTMEINPDATVDGKPMTSGGIYIVDGVKVDAFGKEVKGV